MKTTFNVSLGIDETIQMIKKHLRSSYLTIEVIDEYELLGRNDEKINIIVFEEYFIRVKNRVSLTVVVDEIEDFVRVHCKAGGSQQGRFINWDWGATDDFELAVFYALQGYIVE